MSQHGESASSVQAIEEAMQECAHYEFRVLIIIFCLLRSLTTRLRSVNTIRMVSTTLWKLLAAPRSCVKRMMLSGCFLPCSITVITSAANATSLRFKPVSLVSCNSRKDDVAFLIHLYTLNSVSALTPFSQQDGYFLSRTFA